MTDDTLALCLSLLGMLFGLIVVHFARIGTWMANPDPYDEAERELDVVARPGGIVRTSACSYCGNVPCGCGATGDAWGK